MSFTPKLILGLLLMIGPLISPLQGSMIEEDFQENIHQDKTKPFTDISSDYSSSDAESEPRPPSFKNNPQSLQEPIVLIYKEGKYIPYYDISSNAGRYLLRAPVPVVNQEPVSCCETNYLKYLKPTWQNFKKINDLVGGISSFTGTIMLGYKNYGGASNDVNYYLSIAGITLTAIGTVCHGIDSRIQDKVNAEQALNPPVLAVHPEELSECCAGYYRTMNCIWRESSGYIRVVGGGTGMTATILSSVTSNVNNGITVDTGLNIASLTLGGVSTFCHGLQWYAKHRIANWWNQAHAARKTVEVAS